jgi:hypothetical protein
VCPDPHILCPAFCEAAPQRCAPLVAATCTGDAGSEWQPTSAGRVVLGIAIVCFIISVGAAVWCARLAP